MVDILFAQFRVIDYQQNNTSLSFILELDKINLGGFTEYDKNKRNKYFDESSPGEVSIPSRSTFVAVPPSGEIRVNSNILKRHRYEFRPSINPSVSINQYSSLIYNFDAKLIRSEFEKPDVEFLGTFVYKGIRIAHLKINQVKYYSETAEIEELEKIQIVLNFNNRFVPFSNKSNISAESKSYLSSLVINPEQVEMFSFVGDLPKTNISQEILVPGQNYIKLKIGQDGIYRVYGSDMVACGVNLSTVSPNTIQLFNKGSEQRILVQTVESNSFTEYDYIEFLGERNYTKKHYKINNDEQPYNEYLDRFSDSTVFILTWGRQQGLRVQELNGSLGSPSDTLKYFTETMHIEKDITYLNPEPNLVKRELPFVGANETWYYQRMFLNPSLQNMFVKLNFTLSNLYSNENVSVISKFVSTASDANDRVAHIISVWLNNSSLAIDSFFISKYQRYISNVSVQATNFNNGPNSLIFRSYKTSGSINTTFIDWFEVKYPKTLTANQDSIILSFPFLSDREIRNIKIDNFISNNYSIWKFGNDTVKLNVSKIGNSLIFNSQVDSSDIFMALSSDKIKKPALSYFKQYKNLSDPSNRFDYLLVTHSSLLQKVNEYAQYIRSNFQKKVCIMEVDDIYDNFSSGYPDPNAIREFVRNTQSKWKQPYPDYLLLMGSANYDYNLFFSKYQNLIPKYNLVPSFGVPLSDNYFAVFDSTGAFLPQLIVGRLPVKTNQDIDNYLSRLKNYGSQTLNAWNKRFLLFSGGNPDTPDQFLEFKSINDDVANIAKAFPYGMDNFHFYKTSEPPSNLGPYTSEKIAEEVQKGGLFISYIGHSATQGWDNGITSPELLNNRFSKNPLITDFGCSTGRFGEPDISCFAESALFSPYSQAIAYISNSSFGFTSTATAAPKLFYGAILRDSVWNPARALILAKTKMYQISGVSMVSQLFTLTNTFFGDPLITLAFPTRPDFVFNENPQAIEPNNPQDITDSTFVKVAYQNIGSAVGDTILIHISSTLQGSEYYSRILGRQVPSFNDTITFFLPTKGRVGLHTIRITLNYGNGIIESNYNNNVYTFNVNVAGTKYRLLTNLINENAFNDQIRVLLPSKPSNLISFQYQICDNLHFINPQNFSSRVDTFFSLIDISMLQKGKRYWIRFKDSQNETWSEAFSFLNSNVNGFAVNDSFSFSKLFSSNLNYTEDGIQLARLTKKLSVKSAGFYEGSFAEILLDNINIVPVVSYYGHHVAVFDSKSFSLLNYKYFNVLYGGDQVKRDYTDFLRSVDSTNIVVISVSNDGYLDKNYSLSAAIISEIKKLGSHYIDSIKTRDSWSFVGGKGLPVNATKESYKPAYQGIARIDTIINSMFSEGELITPILGPVKDWDNLILNQRIDSNITFNYKLEIIKNNKVDTVFKLQPVNNQTSLTFLNLINVDSARIRVNLNSQSKNGLGYLKEIMLLYSYYPEFGTNSQSITSIPDTIRSNDEIQVGFKVFNLANITLKNLPVFALLRNPEGQEVIVFSDSINAIEPLSSKTFQVQLKPLLKKGNYELKIILDPEHKYSDFNRDNNSVIKNIIVKEEYLKPRFEILVDGSIIGDGEYISSQPTLTVNFEDKSQKLYSDTVGFKMYLNSTPVFFSDPSVSFDYSSINPKLKITYKPKLSDGEYNFEVISRVDQNSILDTINIKKSFVVLQIPQLLNVYNYPNPFRDNTYFTFKLPVIPEELKIFIYTIAGRKIKTITVPADKLKYDLNTIPWDGKDEDGDSIANGVYLTKINYYASGKTTSVIIKLVRVN